MRHSDDPLLRFIAGAETAVGVLILTLCGGCTLLLTGESLIAALSDTRNAAALVGVPLYAVIGGAPAFGGFLLMRDGYRRYRAARPKPPPSAPPPG